MKPIGLPILATTGILAACSQAHDPQSEEERLRAEAERSAGLEAAEKEILNAGLPLPAENGAEPVAGENGTDTANGAIADRATNGAF